MRDKKAEEIRIISKFQELSNLNFKILPIEEAKGVFKQYSGENPDFIILKENELIGVELFYLSRDKTEQSNGKSNGRNSQIRNLHHRQSKFPSIINDKNDLRKHLESLNKYGLARQEDIEQVLIERIPNKIKKLPLYITPKIWLLGYAREHHQPGIVEDIFKDNTEDILRQSISEKIDIPNRIEKIFLFEPEAYGRSIFEAK